LILIASSTPLFRYYNIFALLIQSHLFHPLEPEPVLITALEQMNASEC
jgi:hypothetical protein